MVPINLSILASPSLKSAFEQEVQDWIKSKVARHKFLRGGVRTVDSIPKRWVLSLLLGVTKEEQECILTNFVAVLF